MHEKLDALVKILEKLDSLIKRGTIEREERPIAPAKKRNEVALLYISYSWSCSEVIDSLCNGLTKAKIPYCRDIKDCGYRENIRRFEEEIGRGSKVLAYISDEYIKSINCMYELALVFAHGDVEKRLFPIVTISNRRDTAYFKELFEYWNSEYQKRKEILDDLPSGASLQAIMELGYCNLIIHELPEIVNYLADVNTLTMDQLSENNFKVLVENLSSI